MATSGSGSFPPAAIQWLAPARPGRVLALGTEARSLVAGLAASGNAVVVTGNSAAAVASACRRPGLRGVAANPAALPFAPCSFDTVLITHDPWTLGPALPEVARVLAPGGRLAALVTVRDDSVPWVRRLAAIVQRHDPEAMRPADELAGTLPAAANFPEVERREFRRWVPVDRDGLLAMVTALPGLRSLAADQVTGLLAEVAALYDTSARQPEPLLLPYTVRCTRAEVDHAELSSVLRPPPGGLQISLQ